MSMNDMILAEARKLEGTYEWAGKDHNPVVLAMYADAGHPEIRQDEVPWCAAYVGSVLAKLGIQNTGSLLAKSYLKWGEKVASLGAAQPGDVVVFNRGAQSWQGHVAFLIGFRGDQVAVLGGNQNNQVNVSYYSKSKIAGIRRVKLPKSSVAQSTTVGASVTGAVGTVAAGVTAIGSLDGTAQTVAVIGGLLALVAFAWIFKERIKKFAEGVR